jgi:hypothetical protein
VRIERGCAGFSSHRIYNAHLWRSEKAFLGCLWGVQTYLILMILVEGSAAVGSVNLDGGREVAVAEPTAGF